MNTSQRQGSARRGRAWHALAGAALALAVIRPAAAQGLDFASSGNVPVEILADNGIEWDQNSQRLVARGNAKAIRGDTTVTADSLIAYYRPRGAAAKATSANMMGGGSNDIYKLEARGHVNIKSPTDNAYGDAATYTVDDAKLLLTGKPARLTTPQQTVTARDGIEYFERDQVAVARGDVVATNSDGRRIRADTMVATLAPRPDGNAKAGRPGTPAKAGASRGNGIKKITAKGNVAIFTETEVAHGDAGMYDVETDIATLTGSVKITRGDNQLNGGYAVVNMKTGISKIFPAPPGAGTDRDRVKLLLVPGKQDDDQGAPMPPKPKDKR